MKYSSLIIGILLTIGFYSNAQVSVTGGSLLTSAPKNCQNIDYSITVQLGCINYVLSNQTYTITGNQIEIISNWTGPGICLPAIGSSTNNITLTSIPAGTYTVTAQGNLNGSNTGPVYSLGSLTVVDCCPINATINGNESSYCIGDTISLSSSYNGNVTAQRWYKNGTLASSNVDYSLIQSSPSTDTFMLVVDTSNICSDTTSVIINTLKNLKLDNDTVVCLFTTIPVNAPSGWTAYSWSTGSTNQNINSSASNTYTLTTTAGSGCMQTDSIMVEHRGPLFSLGQDTTFCGGSSIDLIIDPLWTTSKWIPSNDTNRTLTVDTAGVYVAEVTNNLGCVFQDAIKVTLSDTLIPIMGSDSICEGNTTKLYVDNGNTGITWSTGATTDTIEVTTSGTYTLTATASNNCPVSASAYTHFHALPPVNLGNDTSICQGDTLTLIAGDGSEDYFWYNWVTAAQIEVWRPGTYSVKVTSPENCVKNDTITIAVAKCDTATEPIDTTDTTVFIPQLFNTGFTYKIYPIPVNGTLYIESSDDQGVAEVNIIDVNGKVIMKRIVGNKTMATISTNTIPSGTYILSIKSESGIETRKMVIFE
ncbi:MAG: T9SS type A sorting domain-containing protein [Salibacteraceae bacterium]